MRLVLIFDERRADTVGVYFRRACRELGITGEHWWARDMARIPAGADLYLRIDHGDDYEAPVPAPLHPIVLYAVDTHLPHTWKKIRRVASRYDVVCCSQQDAASTLPNGEWVPLGCDLEWHGHPSTSNTWDLAFVGSEGGVPRTVILQALRERYPNSFIGLAEHTQLGAIYGRARIGFNYAIANEVNMRAFEVLASGALLVTNPMAAESLAALGLQDRRHLVIYRRPAELYATIDEWLSREEERRIIAQAGAEVARQRHTYAHRLAHLLTRVSARLQIKSGRSKVEATLPSTFHLPPSTLFDLKEASCVSL